MLSPCTAAHYAAILGLADEIKVLRSKKADLNIQDEGGQVLQYTTDEID